MKRLMTVALLGALTVTVAARTLAASCSVSIYPNPLVIFSYDWFDPYYDEYVYTLHGSGFMFAASAPPHCVQLQWLGYDEYPLSFWGSRPHIYWSEFLYGDGYLPFGRNHQMGFYPYFVGGELFVFGWDFDEGEPFAGEGTITLTIFKVYF